MVKTLYIAVFFLILVAGKLMATNGGDIQVSQLSDLMMQFKIIELLLFFTLSISVCNYFDNKSWFNSTHDHSLSEMVTEHEDGTITTSVQERWGETPNHSSAKKSFIWSKVSVISSVVGLMIFYIA